MKEYEPMTRYVAALLAGACLLAGEQLPQGAVVASVECQADRGQSYALFLPSNYSPQRQWPILYCLDPRARGRIPVERFSQAAERSGFIVVGSNNSRNGPAGPVQQAANAMIADTHQRFSIDDTRQYTAGFSGGSRMALAWAQNGHIAGVVACGAAFGESVPQQIPFRLFMAAGIDDFNHDEMWKASLVLAKRGVAHRFATFEGDHDWLPPELAVEALEFFNGQVPPKAAEDTKADRKQAAKYEALYEQVWSAGEEYRRSLLSTLRKDSSRTEDTPQRRVARRVIGGTFVRALEQAQPLMDSKDYKGAVPLFETAVAARPDYGWAWFGLALAYGGAGNRTQALKALEQAVDRGFRDRERMEHEALLERVRSDPRYAALVNAMAGP